MPEQNQPLETWAIVELFGHTKLAGFVTQRMLGTAAMFHIAVPETQQPGFAGRPDYTTQPYEKYIGVSSIFALTPCTEAVARAAAQTIERHHSPIPVDLPRVLQLAAGAPTQDAELIADPDEDDAPYNDDDDFFDDGPEADHDEIPEGLRG